MAYTYTLLKFDRSHFGSRWFNKLRELHSDFLIREAFVRMLQVLSLSGDQIAVLETEEGADDSVKGIKQRLAQKVGLTRFRLRLVTDNRTMKDDEAI